ncbi:splicing regulatory glutamine/lysine-rich-like protein isoform X2 [Wolffia australiana]
MNVRSGGEDQRNLAEAAAVRLVDLGRFDIKFYLMDEKKRKKEKKSKEKERLRDIGSRNLDSFKEISKDDYFSKNNEFSTWLKEEKGTFFSELTSEAARELFLSFVKLWNKQKLDSRYYEGIARAPRTGHHWKIRN